MARIPDPVPGLIFRYGYLWLEEFEKKRIDPSKDRPACILMRVVGKASPGLRTTGASAIAPGDVIIFPITTRRPPRNAVAVELSVDDKRLCRLDPEVPSWLVVSEFNADSWPNADISLVPGTNQFAYGFAPPGLMHRIRRSLAGAAHRKTVVGVKRYSSP